jgi:hypothetical protein
MRHLTISLFASKVYLLVKGILILGIISWSFAQSLPPPLPTPREDGQPIQHETSAKEQHTSDKDSPPQHATPPNAINISQGPQTTEPRNNQGNISKQPASDEGIHGAIWFTAIFTGGLVLAGFLQLLAMLRQARYMHQTLRMTEQTLKVTQQAADAATTNAEIATQALHLTQRAYLIMSDWALTNGSTHDAPLHVGFDIMNVGHTPAVQVEICMDSLIASSLPALPRYEHPSLLENLPPSVVLMYTWPQEIRERMPDGTFLWVWGRLTYHDVFGRQHAKGFCARCQPNRIPPFSFPIVAGYVYDD